MALGFEREYTATDVASTLSVLGRSHDSHTSMGRYPLLGVWQECLLSAVSTPSSSLYNRARTCAIAQLMDQGRRNVIPSRFRMSCCVSVRRLSFFVVPLLTVIGLRLEQPMHRTQQRPTRSVSIPAIPGVHRSASIASAGRLRWSSRLVPPPPNHTVGSPPTFKVARSAATRCSSRPGPPTLLALCSLPLPMSWCCSTVTDSVELARQAIQSPEIEADAFARPDTIVNPVDLGTILVPAGWLLLGPGQSATLDLAVISRVAAFPRASLNAAFESAPGVRFRLRSPLPQVSLPGTISRCRCPRMIATATL